MSRRSTYFQLIRHWMRGCFQGPEYPELQCPVGTEQIAGLVLAATQRIPGIEVAMATGVDEAISRFPAVLDMLGNEQVSRMDGCNRENLSVCVVCLCYKNAPYAFAHLCVHPLCQP